MHYVFGEVITTIRARSCTQQPAFLPFTALPKSCIDGLFAVVRLVPIPDPEDSAAVPVDSELPGL